MFSSLANEQYFLILDFQLLDKRIIIIIIIIFFQLFRFIGGLYMTKTVQQARLTIQTALLSTHTILMF